MDKVSKETRSKIMASIKSKGTKMEFACQPMLEALGFEYHPKGIMGNPDFAHAQAMPAPMLVPSSPSMRARTVYVIEPAGISCLFISLQPLGSIELTATRLHCAMPAFLSARSNALSSETGLTAFPLVMKNSFGIIPVFQYLT